MKTLQDLVKTEAFGNLKTVGLFRSSKKPKLSPLYTSVDNLNILNLNTEGFLFGCPGYDAS